MKLTLEILAAAELVLLSHVAFCVIVAVLAAAYEFFAGPAQSPVPPCPRRLS